MHGIDRFDHSGFSISQSEALSMDPQHRLILELSGQALYQHSAGGMSSDTGVFIGISWTEYSQLNAVANNGATAYTAQGAVLSVCPGRVSYHYGLKGPSVAMDTACSSSLVATTSARDYTLKSAGGAVVGGINMMLKGETTNMFKKAGMLSPDGRCKAFDQSANGYVRSESCVVMLLSCHNETQGAVLLRGAAINQDGRSSSLTAPNGPSQQAVIREALSGSSISVKDVTGLQTHGT